MWKGVGNIWNTKSVYIVIKYLKKYLNTYSTPLNLLVKGTIFSWTIKC